jgi:hypothetical protein
VTVAAKGGKCEHPVKRIGDRSRNIAEDVVHLVTVDVEDLNP